MTSARLDPETGSSPPASKGRDRNRPDGARGPTAASQNTPRIGDHPAGDIGRPQPPSPSHPPEMVAMAGRYYGECGQQRCDGTSRGFRARPHSARQDFVEQEEGRPARDPQDRPETAGLSADVGMCVRSPNDPEEMGPFIVSISVASKSRSAGVSASPRMGALLAR